MSLQAAREHLQRALAELSGIDETVDPSSALKEWYLIAVHEDEDGQRVFSRYSPAGQSNWLDAGLLTFARDLDRSETTSDQD